MIAQKWSIGHLWTISRVQQKMILRWESLHNNNCADLLSAKKTIQRQKKTKTAIEITANILRDSHQSGQVLETEQNFLRMISV